MELVHLSEAFVIGSNLLVAGTAVVLSIVTYKVIEEEHKHTEKMEEIERILPHTED